MIRSLAVSLFALAVFAGCDTNAEQDGFFIESEQFPDGYTATDEAGNVVGDADPNDWRVAPAFQGAVTVQEAFPNPVNRGGLITITITDTFDDAIVGGVFARGRRNNDPAQPLRLAEDLSAGPVYVLTVYPTQLRVTAGDAAELFRVRVFTEDFRLITYGDILVR